LTIWFAVYFLLGSIILEYKRFGLHEIELDLIKEKAKVVDDLLSKMRITKFEARIKALSSPITEKGIDL
jgi:hypothetical protein